MSSRIRRSFVSFSIAALCAGFVFVGGSGSALARADCLQTDPQADVFVTITSLTSSQLHAVVTNDGQCNVPDAVVTITLPVTSPASTFSFVTTNPTSWKCGGLGTGTLTCPSSGGGPTIGVPGNHDFDATFSLGTSTTDLTITTRVVVGGGDGVSGVCDSSSATTCDKYQDNNVVWAAVIPEFTGGALTTCPDHPNREGAGNSLCGSKQFTDVSVGKDGSAGNVFVQQLGLQVGSSCPTNFPNCFGKLVSIKSLIIDTLTTKTFTIDGSLAHGSYGGVSLIHCSDPTTESSCVSSSGGWSPVANCSRTNPTYPCVVTKTKFKVAGITYYQFVVLTDGDDGWGFDG